MPTISATIRNNRKREDIDELEWLHQQGIIFEPENNDADGLLSSHDEYNYFIRLEAQHLNDFAKYVLGQREASGYIEEIESTKYMQSLIEAQLRRFAVQLREVNHMDAYPLLDTFHSVHEHQATKDAVLQIVLNTLPYPDESISWEQIIEYRSDPDSQDKFLDLRHWMSEMARGELTPIEVEEKLEYLMSQYQRHMKLHKMKANQGVLETVIVSPAELAENLIKFKWGQIAKDLFSIKQRKIALMEGELTSPGSEVAYIVKARETFS